MVMCIGFILSGVCNTLGVVTDRQIYWETHTRTEKHTHTDKQNHLHYEVDIGFLRAL